MNKKVTAMTSAPIAPPYQLSSTRHGTMLANSNDAYMGQAFLRYESVAKSKYVYCCLASSRTSTHHLSAALRKSPMNGLLNVNALSYACGKDSGGVSFEVPDYRPSSVVCRE
jgi:hypothetical protein